MDDASCADIVGEIIAAARRLIRFAADLPSAEMEQQERSHSSMADKGDVIALVGSEREFDFAHDTTLGIDSSLPSANADVRIGRASCRERV